MVSLLLSDSCLHFVNRLPWSIINGTVEKVTRYGKKAIGVIGPANGRECSKKHALSLPEGAVQFCSERRRR